MKELSKEKLECSLAIMEQNSIQYSIDNNSYEIRLIPEIQQARKQIEEMIKLFHSPLGHMTKYNPKEEWIRIK